MAGRKLPALPSLADFPAQDDLIYGVDVSDTSESPQGTSKQIEFSEIMNTGKSVITPTVTAGTGTVNDFTCIFYRMGNNVHMDYFCRGYIIALGEATTTVTLDLTGTGFEPTSNFSSGFQVYGSVNSVSYTNSSGTVQEVGLSSVSSSKNVQISVQLTANATGSDFETVVGGSFSYEIVPV